MEAKKVIRTYPNGSQLEFRDAVESDFSLIANSFWRDASEAAPDTGRMFLVAMLEKAIANPQWHVTVCCHPSEPDEILCWAIYRGKNEFLWIFRKPRYKGLHFASKMLEFIGTPRGNRENRVPIYCVAIPTGMWRRAIDAGYELKARPYMVLTGG